MSDKYVSKYSQLSNHSKLIHDWSKFSRLSQLIVANVWSTVNTSCMSQILSWLSYNQVKLWLKIISTFVLKQTFTYIKPSCSWVLLASCSREENLKLSNVWLGCISQSCGTKSGMCFHQTFTAMLRSYDRTWWYLRIITWNICMFIFTPDNINKYWCSSLRFSLNHKKPF